MARLDLFDASHVSTVLRTVGERRQASSVFSEKIAGEVLIALAEALLAIDEDYRPLAASQREKEAGK